MIDLLPNVSIRVDKNIYIKDPTSSNLGLKILSGGIDMIHDLGFEDFTFRKLAKHIESTEASIYRYFESKQKLLIYLSSWYWSWQEYRLVFNLANIISPIERLKKAIYLLTAEIDQDNNFTHINEVKLNQIVISESSKAYLTKLVDQENSAGAYRSYKQVVGRVSDIILEIDPEFKYPHMLISTAIEGAHHQRFFVDHLPKLTDIVRGEDAITIFYIDMVFKTLSIK